MMMGSTGGHHATKNDDDKLTIDNLWKILDKEKRANETGGLFSQHEGRAESRSRSRNAVERGYEHQAEREQQNQITSGGEIRPKFGTPIFDKYQQTKTIQDSVNGLVSPFRCANGDYMSRSAHQQLSNLKSGYPESHPRSTAQVSPIRYQREFNTPNRDVAPGVSSSSGNGANSTQFATPHSNHFSGHKMQAFGGVYEHHQQQSGERGADYPAATHGNFAGK